MYVVGVSTIAEGLLTSCLPVLPSKHPSISRIGLPRGGGGVYPIPRRRDAMIGGTGPKRAAIEDACGLNWQTGKASANATVSVKARGLLTVMHGRGTVQRLPFMAGRQRRAAPVWVRARGLSSPNYVRTWYGTRLPEHCRQAKAQREFTPHSCLYRSRAS